MGNLVAADNAHARIRRTYYPSGLLKTDTLIIRTLAEVQDGTSWTRHVYGLRYEYDRNGRRRVLQHPKQLRAPVVGFGQLTTYAYNAQTGNLQFVGDPAGNGFGFRLNMRNELDTLQLPANRYLRYVHDVDGNVEREIGSFTSGTWRDIAFVYDARGKRTSARNAVFPADTLTAEYSGLGYLVAKSLILHPPAPSGTHLRNVTTESFVNDALGNLHRRNTLRVQQYSSGCTVPVSCFTPFRRDSLWYTNTFETETARLATAEGAGMTDTLFYTGAGDIEFTRGDRHQFNDAKQADRASYYDADGKVRAVDYRTVPHATWQGDFSYTWVFEEHRYDPLGRRVLTWVRRFCQVSDMPPEHQSECNEDFVRRTVWDGDEELWEIQMPAEPSTPADTVENDTLPVQRMRWTTTGFDPNPLFGRVLYTHGPVIDRPLAVTRINYSDDPGSGWQNWSPFSIIPLWNYRGQVDKWYYTWAQGGGSGVSRCLDVNQTRCVKVYFPEVYSAYGLELKDPYPWAWHGTLTLDKRDESGIYYRRNRYYDPKTGRFTQEDPIGLAGGLNLYGFAGGDPLNFSDPFGLCPNPLARGWGALQCTLQDLEAGARAWMASAAKAVIRHVEGKLEQLNACFEDPVCVAMGTVPGGRGASVIRAGSRVPLPRMKPSAFGPKVGDAIPSGVPRNWSADDIADAIMDYKTSIASRRAELAAFDAAGGGSAIERLAHARRITQEEAYLRSLERALRDRR